MSRPKRPAVEQEHAANRDAEVEGSSGDDNDLRTPQKKVRLNLARGDSSGAEETKAAAYLEAPQRLGDEGHYVITPGLSASKKAFDDTRDSESGSLSFPGDGTADVVRRSLFTEEDASKPQLVTPSRSQLATPESPAKRRLIFGRHTTEIAVLDSVRKMYALIRKLTGSIGGNASHGPIYGELTIGSMQKMVNLMKEHTAFDRSSRFIDVGSGIGKPNFHVAIDPGVDLSYGLEVDADRWLLSMNCLRGTLVGESKQSCDFDGSCDGTNMLPDHNCIFIHGDIRSARVFDPFTHVYMFSIGFPPALWVDLAKIWNRSTSPFLICFHGPKDIIRSYEFDVELIAQTPTSMHGSKEGHTGYVYRRQSNGQPLPNNNEAASDPCFAEGIDVVRGGAKKLKTWVESTLNRKMSAGATTRARRRVLDKSDKKIDTSDA